MLNENSKAYYLSHFDQPHMGIGIVASIRTTAPTQRRSTFMRILRELRNSGFRSSKMIWQKATAHSCIGASRMMQCLAWLRSSSTLSNCGAKVSSQSCHCCKGSYKKSKGRASNAGQRLKRSCARWTWSICEKKMKEFLADWVHQYQALVKGESVKDLHGRDVTTFKLSRFHSYDPACYGKTLKQEMHVTPIDKDLCPWLLSCEELLSEERIGGWDQHLGEELRMNYHGMASFERSLEVMEYMMIARDFDHVSDNNIRIMARGHGKHGTRTFPSNATWNH